MKLHEIVKEGLELEQLFNSQIDEETGEIKDYGTIVELEDEWKKLLEDKSGKIIQFIKIKEGEINVVDEEIKRLQAIKKREEKKVENFKNYIKHQMLIGGIEDITTPLGKISFRKSVETIIDENIIDKKYGTLEQTWKFNKTELKKIIASGQEIEGVKLVENKNLQIK